MSKREKRWVVRWKGSNCAADCNIVMMFPASWSVERVAEHLESLYTHAVWSDSCGDLWKWSHRLKASRLREFMGINRGIISYGDNPQMEARKEEVADPFA